MTRIESIREKLATLYKETSIWEEATQSTDWHRIPKYRGKEIIGYSDFTTASNFEEFIMSEEGNYRYFFEKLKNESESEPTLYDYHCLYTKLLQGIFGWFTDNMFYIEQRDTSINFYDSLYAQEKEEAKLELVFCEFTDKLKKSENNTIEKIDAIFNEVKKKTEYDEALINAGYIDEDFNAINSAPDIATFLVEEWKMENLKAPILRRYKTNGKPFTLYTAQKAVTLAKTNLKKQKK